MSDLQCNHQISINSQNSHLTFNTIRKTEKQKNPHQAGMLSWAAWVIARLGGWKGYQSESPPGPITINDGWKRFKSIYEGWTLKDVCIE